jgi:Anti-sigma-K factor rskA
MSSDDDRVAYLAGDGTEAPFFPEGADELDELRGLLSDATLWDDPPASLEDDVVAAVMSAAAEAPPEPVTDVPFPRTEELPVVPDAPAPGTAPLAGAPTSIASPSADRPAPPGPAAPEEPAPAPAPVSLDERRRRVWPAALASAVAAAAAVLVGVVVVSGSWGDDPADATFEAALAPTELVLEASGTVSATRFDSGWRLELDATGLPRLADGQFYQAWLLGPGDVLVPVGSFNEGEDVVLWAGVSPADFTAFTVTREVADGNQGSSGQRVLAGPLTATDG